MHQAKHKIIMEIEDQLNKLLNEIKGYQNLNTNFNSMISTLQNVSNTNENKHQKIKDSLSKMSVSSINLQAKYSDYISKLTTATSEIKEVSNQKLKELDVFTDGYKKDVDALKTDFLSVVNSIKTKADESINTIKRTGVTLYNENQKLLNTNEIKLNEISQEYLTNVKNQNNSLNDAIDKFRTDCTYLKSNVESKIDELKKENENLLNEQYDNHNENIKVLFEDLKNQNTLFLENKFKELKENELNKLIKNQLLYSVAILLICLVTMGFTIYSILN